MNKEMQELRALVERRRGTASCCSIPTVKARYEELTWVLSVLPKEKPAATPNPPKKPSGYSDCFEAWWAAYPRKVGKRKAFAAWKIAVVEIARQFEPDGGRHDKAVALLLETTEQFADSPKGNAGSYTPHPTTWLNQGRYDDDPAEWEDTGDNDGPQVPVKFRN